MTRFEKKLESKTQLTVRCHDDSWWVVVADKNSALVIATPEQAEALAAALLAAAKVARGNEAQNGRQTDYQADSQTR